MRVAVAAILSSALLTWAQPACAIDLAWSAPRECLDRAQMLEELGALSARHGRSLPEVSARGELQRVGSGKYQLKLSIDAAGSEPIERLLEDPDCVALSKAAAWLLVLSRADESATPSQTAAEHSAPRPVTRAPSSQPAEGRVAEKEPEPEQAPAPEEEPREPPAPEPQLLQSERQKEPEAAETRAPGPQTKRRRFRLGARWGRVGVGVGVWSAELAGPHLALAARLAVARGPLLGELSLSGMLPREQTLGAGAELTVHSQALSLAGCWAAGERLRVGPCLGLAGTLTYGSIDGIRRANNDRVPWLSAELLLLMLLKLAGPLDLSLRAGGGLPITARPRFVVENRGEVSRASLLSIQAELGLGLRWQ